MTKLATEAAIKRFGENEERVNKFVNTNEAYLTNESTPREVESLPHLMTRLKERYLTAIYRGAWATSTSYSVNDGVKQDGVVYLCAEAHISGNFATDLAGGKWGVAQGISPAELSSSEGASKVGVSYPDSDYVRPLQVYINDCAINAKQYRLKGDGTSDDSDYMLEAADAASGKELYLPPGKYRFTKPIPLLKGMHIVGANPVVKGQGGVDFGGGTWLYFDHGGKGIQGINTNGYFTDLMFSRIGTFRNQPAPVVNWIPNDHDYDFDFFGIADVVLNNVVCLNPTRAVNISGNPSNGSGRLELYNFRSQAFKVGIKVDTVYDVVRMDEIHIWPFWRDDMNVHNYCMRNLDAIHSVRNDNPMLSNIFSIFARAGLRISQGENGGTSKIHLVNADFDRGAFGIWVDSSVTNGATGQFENITHQGESGANVGSKGIFIQGNNSSFQFGNFDSAENDHNAIRCEGTGNRLQFGNVRIPSFDKVGGNYPAIEAYTGNTFVFATVPNIGSGVGNGGRFAPTGTIVCDNWRTFTPAVSSQNGSISSWTSSGLYKIVGDTVHVKFLINIINAGNGSGDVRFNLPFSNPAFPCVGTGREGGVNGKLLSISTNTGETQARIYNYDNTYCGIAGAALVGEIQYRIAI